MSNQSESEKTNASNARNDLNLRPAFGSNAQALWFLILVIFALVLPKIITNFNLISRADSYDIMSENNGGYIFIKDEIFHQKDDIDILFIGGSVIWNAVDTPQVQKALSEELGRPAKVVTFGFNFNSIDIPYTQLRDLLERRRVRMVVFSIPRLSWTKGPSTLAYKFLRYDENRDVVDGLSPESRISLYACNVLRSPRDLLTIVRQNPSMVSPYSKDLGAFKKAEGMVQNPETFQRFTPPSPVFSSSDLIYSSKTQADFYFTNAQLSAHQDHYLNKLVELLKEKKTPLVMLNVPQYSEKHSNKIIELQDWSKRTGTEIPLIGIAPTVLFKGLNEQEVEKLHCDPEHFNKNGNEYFTRTVLPAILEVYEKHATKSF